MKEIKCLCNDIDWENPPKTITQIVEIEYQGTTVNYLIERDNNEGNITCWDKQFQLPPHIENGGIHYNEALTVVNDVIDKSTPVDFDNIDQYLWDMDENQPFTLPIELPYGEYQIQFTIIKNELT